MMANIVICGLDKIMPHEHDMIYVTEGSKDKA